MSKSYMLTKDNIYISYKNKKALVAAYNAYKRSGVITKMFIDGKQYYIKKRWKRSDTI